MFKGITGRSDPIIKVRWNEEEKSYQVYTFIEGMKEQGYRWINCTEEHYNFYKRQGARDVFPEGLWK